MNVPAGTLWDWRPGERRLVLLMTANYFLFLLFFYLLKPARDSLFLVNLEPAGLPWVYILTALLAAPLVGAHARAGGRMRLENLTALTTIALMASLALMRLLISVQHDLVYFLFYGLVAVAGGVTVSQFWLMANAVFDSVQARRLFPLLAVGGIAGAVAGGEITGFLLDHGLVDTRDLILAAIIVLGLAGLVTSAVWRFSPLGGEPAPGRMDGSGGGGTWSVLKLVAGSRHLRLTVLIIALSVLTGSLVDYQFMTLSWEAFPGETQLTAFLGKFYGRVSLVALLVQLVLTTRLLRRLGAGGVLFVLPGILLLGSAFLLAVPGLLAGMALRGTDLSLKYSLDKTSRELLFMPVPLALKKRTKLFIDTLVDRLARGVAGGLLLLITLIWGLELRHVTVITVVLLVLWLVAAYFMRLAYIDSFRQAVARRHIHAEDLKINVSDSSSRKILIRILQQGSDREILFALRTVADLTEPQLVEVVRPLLGHPSAEIRRLCLEFLTVNSDERDTPQVEALLEDVDLEVRVAAIAFLARHRAGRSGPRECLAGMVFSAPKARNAAVAYLARFGGPDRALPMTDLVDREVVQDILRDASPWAVEGRRLLAALPWLPHGCTAELWDRLLVDPEPEVVTAALQGVGARAEVERASWLMEQLGRPALHSAVRRAFVAMAHRRPEVVGHLERFLHAGGIPLAARREIPAILGRITTQQSVQVLLSHLSTHIPEMRYQCLKALNRLRSADPRLRFDVGLVAMEINLEASRYLQLQQVLGLITGSGPGDRLLRRVLVEARQLRQESVFRLMGLLYPAADVAGAHARLVGKSRLQRADALEFLDNILSEEHRSLVRYLVENEDLDRACRLLGMKREDQPSNREQALDFLSLSCDPWLAACARFAGAAAENPAAEVYLTRKDTDMLTPIERVLILQEVDVFADLPADLLAGLATLATEVQYLAGDILFRQEDLPDAMYVILEGTIDIYQDGRFVMTNTRGQHVGLWALFHDEPRPLTAVVGQDALLLRIDQTGFNELLAGDIRLAKSMMKVLARYLFEFVAEYGWRRPEAAAGSSNGGDECEKKPSGTGDPEGG